MTTFLAIAENSKLEYVEYSSEAEGLLEKTAAGFMITRIVIRPKVVVKDSAAVDRARRTVEKAERHCLISKSMKTQVLLEPEINTQ